MRKNLVLAIAASALLLCGRSSAIAQTVTYKPVLAVSFAAHDELMKDVDYFAGLAGRGKVSALLEGQLQQHLGPGGLAGLDRTRPCGAVILTDGTQFTPLLFVPVSSLQQLLESLAPVIGPAENVGNGTWRVTAGTMPVRIKEQGNWAFATADSAVAVFDKLPTNPVALLDGMDKDYDVGIRAYVHNVPDAYRAQALMFMQMGVNAAAQQRAPDETDAQFAARQQMMQAQLDQMDTIINEMDQCLFALKIDAQAQQALVDFKLTVVPGSKLAPASAQEARIESAFTGMLMPGAAIQLNAAAKVSEYEASQIDSYLGPIRAIVMQMVEEEAELPNEEARSKLKSIVSELIDLYVETAKSGKMDFASSAKMDAENLVFVGGAYVASEARVEKMLREAADLAKQDPNFPGVNFNAETLGRVKLHTMIIPVPQDEHEAREILGERLEMVIGTGPQQFYFAGGKNAIAALKQAIAAKGPTGLPPVQYVVALGPILQFASRLEKDDTKLHALADSISALAGRDRIIVTGQFIDRGQEMRLLLEEGVLKTLGTAAQQHD